jgi:hypothetical protein
VNESGTAHVQRGVQVSADPIVRQPASTIGELTVTRTRTVEEVQAELGEARLALARRNVEINDLHAANDALRWRVAELEAVLEAAR